MSPNGPVHVLLCRDSRAQPLLSGLRRRTALTNMIEPGLSEKEAMEFSGHRTRAVFDRYHIVSDRRMQQNAGKLDAHHKAKEAAAPAEKGTVN